MKIQMIINPENQSELMLLKNVIDALTPGKKGPETESKVETRPPVQEVELEELDPNGKYVKPAKVNEEPIEIKGPAKIDEKPIEIKGHTADQVGDLVQEKVQAGHKEKIKKILKEYGAKTVATLPDDKLEEFYQAVKKIA